MLQHGEGDDAVERSIVGGEPRQGIDVLETDVRQQRAGLVHEMTLALEAGDLVEELRQQDRHAAKAGPELARARGATAVGRLREQRAQVALLEIGACRKCGLRHVDDVCRLPDDARRSSSSGFRAPRQLGRACAAWPPWRVSQASVRRVRGVFATLALTAACHASVMASPSTSLVHRARW